MGLYHTYRPKTLEEMMGNSAQLKAVTAHFAQPPEKWAHAHLIDGPSGTGKTTLARAISNSLLGATALTFRELNSAETRGIDTVREIMEQCRMKPLNGGYMIYVIDECHKLTPDAKTAFLKLLEDTPKHVFFFFCTTDSQTFLKGDAGKALKTRFTRWSTEPLTGREIVKLVSRVAEAEKIEMTDKVLEAIVETAEGSPRMALVALEKVAPICFEEERLEVLKKDVVDESDTKELCQALMKGSWRETAAVLKKLKSQNADPETIRRGVLGYLTAVLLNGKESLGQILEAFTEPTYNSGFPGLVSNAWIATHPDD